MEKETFLFKAIQKTEATLFVRVIRGGLIMMIPVLMIGAFSLIGESLPIPAYNTFINNFAGGIIYYIFDMTYKSTFGMLSVFMTLTIAVSYWRETDNDKGLIAGPLISSLTSFFVLSGVFHKDFELGSFGPKGMITALLSGFFASMIYYALWKVARKRKLYASGADTQFNAAVSAIFPIAATVLCFVIVNTVLSKLFGAYTLYEIISQFINFVFKNIGNNFFGGLLFVLASGILWFFGIHGSDCLEGAMQTTFVPGLQQNIDNLAAGNVPDQILTKQFFDVFVLMGGCGTTLCLLLALLIFGKRKSNRQMARFAFFPMLFNINEIMIFGLPVILNPVMLIPFVITPVVCYLISYTAIAIGLVASTISYVEWTTPIFLGGYIATGSVSGCLLQLFNLLIGILIYMPFVRMLDRQKMLAAEKKYINLVKILQKCEENREEIVLTERSDLAGQISKELVLELQEAIQKKELTMYYQPQCDYNGKCFGVEALLRWNHKVYHNIYPPLIIKLAREAGFLEELEKKIIKRSIEDGHKICSILGNEVEISVNITGQTLMSEGFTDFLRTVYSDSKIALCLEIAEQTAVLYESGLKNILQEVKEMGIKLAIDDFSMGQTSISYLMGKEFGLVKLDGSLTRELLENPRCEDIISSIVGLAQRLEFSVLAEYVETEEQKERLAQIGCVNYQGYLYSPAVPLEELDKRMKGDSICN